jgi:glycosyltransferase involved in cell wall biosynthesis
MSSVVWEKKQKMLEGNNVFFVACSRWLEDEAKKSALLEGKYISSIPNAIDTHIYHPKDKTEARKYLELPTDKRVILFVSQRVTDSRKGMSYFTEAISNMTKQDPELCNNTVVAILGGHSEEISSQLSLPVFSLGYINDEKLIVNIYNAADVFVLPSI